jgi:hypothetical protein
MKAAYAAILSLALLPQWGVSLESLDESQLSDVTGEGIGVVFEDFSLFTKLPNRPEEGELTLILDDKGTDVKSDDDAFIFSDIRVHRSDFEYSDTADFTLAGGRFGTEAYPFKAGDLVQVSSILDNKDVDADNSKNDGVPNFTYTALHMEFPGGSLSPEELTPEILELMSDKFDLSVRIDSVIGSRPEGEERQFNFSVAVEGFRFYGFEQDIWSIPYYGVAMSNTIGLLADSIVIGGDTKGALSGNLTLNGIDLYLPNGSADQPIILNTVNVNGKEQFQIEMLPLTREIAAARGDNYPKGHLRIKSIDFGDPKDPSLRTALKPGGDPLEAEDYYYAFQPEYGNVIDIEGINIQHLRITTMDI